MLSKCLTIRTANHRGAKREIPGSALESASEGAKREISGSALESAPEGALESAPEGAVGNRGVLESAPEGALPVWEPRFSRARGSTFQSTSREFPFSTLGSSFQSTSREFPFSTPVAGRPDCKTLVYLQGVFVKIGDFIKSGGLLLLDFLENRCS